MMYFKPSDFGPRDCDDLNAILEEKLRLHIAALSLYGRAKALAKDSGTAPRIAATPQQASSAEPAKTGTSPICPDCAWMAEEGGGYCATHRRGCEGCGRVTVELHEGDYSRTKLTREGKPIMELWCMDCDPITEDVIPVGERFADGQPDSWDLASEELIESASLPRETPAYWGRDRADYDPNDDKSDLNPWGVRETR